MESTCSMLWYKNKLLGFRFEVYGSTLVGLIGITKIVNIKENECAFEASVSSSSDADGEEMCLNQRYTD